MLVFAIFSGCRLWPEDLHLGVDNKPDSSALFLHLAQAKEGLHHGGSIADKVDFALPETMNTRVSPADGIPRSCL